MKVAYFSPMPPERSGIADYSALLVPALARRLDVRVMRRGTRRPPRGSDLAVYHIGNDAEHHAWIVAALRRHPGVVVLHDAVLHHLIAGMTLARGDREGYLAALQRDAGVVGRLLAHGVVDGLVPPLWETRPQDFPMTGEIFPWARGLIVHSRAAEAAVCRAGYRGPVWTVPHPAWPVPGGPETEVPVGDPLIGTFGHLNRAKRVDVLLAAFARVLERRPGARLLLVGSVAEDLPLDAWIDRLGIGEAVVRVGRVDEEQLWALLSATDVVVSLRWPSMGETSGIALRALSVGRPLVVTDAGWFSELPDAVAAKVPVGPLELPLLAEVLARLAGDGGLRAAMGEAARRLATGPHDLERVADRHAEVMETMVGGETVRNRVLREVAEAAAFVGLEPAGADLEHTAMRLREVSL